MAKILVIDDEQSLREVLELMLTRAGHQVIVAEDGQKGLDSFTSHQYDLVISDIRMPGLDGLALLKGVKEFRNAIPVILISAFAGVETAVSAMREGAYDFIPKPFRSTDMLAVVDSALANQNVEREREALAAKVRENQRFGRLVGSSAAMLQVYDLIQRAAQTSTSILITGESGTGKELVARTVHENSPRAEGPFVAINCGGMPEQLIESELFGYKKGAFTGANNDKPGLMSLADKGSLFLDELAELTLPMQVKLLRAVQEKSFRPVGGDKELTSDIRFIAATNKNLEAEVMAGRFREDLYYRLNVINIRIPPLRERESDIPLLAHFFLEKHSKKQNKNLRKLSAYALDILSHYNFPGNVRELENIIERSVALEQSNIILPESLRLSDFKRGGLGTFELAPPNTLAPPVNMISPAGFPAEGPPTHFPATANYYDNTLAPTALVWSPGANPPPGAFAPLAPQPAESGYYNQPGNTNFRSNSDLSHLPPTFNSNWAQQPPPVHSGGFHQKLDLPPGGLNEYLAALEQHYLWQALLAAEGARVKAAALLNISSWRFRMRLATHARLAEMSLKELITIGPQAFPMPCSKIARPTAWIEEGLDLDLVLTQAESQYFEAAMQLATGNKTEASTMLGISRRTLQHRLERGIIK